ncbi:MAG: Magnesium and cobalt transport protein CorA [uncultured Sulfurovum sp.]|uniref:Magnesium and cobalt transport protein CorA n=1 Tax=uncultured Sulfurovum sp. TaxID=269237 RepID=A0A6S6U508_9BACT|nr:MAG: Magnesium and cobalt transport protein CorA [uncultured Sulfurovum sp.]
MIKTLPQIDTLHLEDLNNTLHPSIFDENDDYDMLIVRLPVIQEDLTSLSLGFVFTQEHSHQYNTIEKRFETLEDRFEGPYHVIDVLLDKLLKAFTSYQDQILDMEESLYDDAVKTTFMTHWLSLKRDILRIERIMLRTSDVMQEMITHYEHVEGFPMNHYVDIHEHCERIVRASTLQLSKLDYLYNFYNTRTNEKMNRLIFFLTIISAIFLPLNLIVGFFGMNTSGLPFTDGSQGTLNVVGSLLLLIVVTTLGVLLWQRKIEHSK